MKCAVIGHPIKHSLSPVLHNAGYKYLGIDWCYQAIDILPTRFEDFVFSLDNQWRGLSVTMPHKISAAKIGIPDDNVALLKVANTIVFDQDVSVYNTDILGCENAIIAAGVKTVESAIILGNGATASSILAALANLGLKYLTVVVRNAGKANQQRALAEQLGIELVEQTYESVLPKVDLLASTIPGNAVPIEKVVAVAPVIFDAIYDPWPTPLAIAATQNSINYIDGLQLLVWQATEQFRLFTGSEIPAAVMAIAGRDELAKRSSSATMA